MEDQNTNEYHKLDMALQSERSEEVSSIIERMPSKFGLAITGIIVFIFSLLILFGFISRYPDISVGQIIVNTNNAPIKLIANANGKLRLNVRTLENVAEGQVVAYIENATSPNAVDRVYSTLRKYNPAMDNISTIQSVLPRNLSLGELNVKYYAFINAIQQYVNYQKDGAFDKQNQSLQSILIGQKKSLASIKNQLVMSESSLKYVYKFYKRDSLLFKKKVISEAELDQTEMNYLTAKDRVQSSTNTVLSMEQAIQETQSQMQQLQIQDPEKEKDLNINLISTYNDLLDNIKLWEQKYVFRMPFKGKLQFLKFYTDKQFIQAGDAVFTLVPVNERPYGQVTLPALGAGKVEIGQEVIVKLDNYPYMEYGSIEGRVKTISLTTNTQKTQSGELETYLVTVDFPKGLRTNYGAILDFKHESKGTAEIITKDRTLLARLFDNLKYATHK